MVWKSSVANNQSEEEDEGERLRERPGRRGVPAVFANLILLAVALGGPYLRGRWRAAPMSGHFADFASCVFGGEPAREAGLALPPGERARYASRVVLEGPGWPARCLPALARLRPEPAVFLFPGPKQAEEDLRRAAELMHAELESLERARQDEQEGLGAVPERPLRALSRLQAAISRVLEAADFAVDARQHALTFENEPASQLIDPSRVPLGVAESASLEATLLPGGFRVAGLDGERVAQTRVEGPRVFEVRTRRPVGSRAIAMSAEGALVLWAQSEEACSRDSSGCVQRGLGLSPISEGELHPRIWLGAHPALRFDRAIRFVPGGAWIAARTARGEGAALRRFEWDELPLTDSGDVPRSVAVESQDAGSLLDVRSHLRGRAWLRREEGELTVQGDHLPETRLDPRAILGERTRAARRSQVAIEHCGRVAAIAMPEGIIVVRSEGVVEAIPLPLREPILGAEPRSDALRALCRSDGTMELFPVLRDRSWVRIRCRERCAAPEALGSEVSAVDVGLWGELGLAAWTGDSAHPQIYVRRLSASEVGAREIPAACWDNGVGFCGPPMILADESRALVLARESADVLVVAAAPSGFVRLPGL